MKKNIISLISLFYLFYVIDVRIATDAGLPFGYVFLAVLAFFVVSMRVADIILKR